MKLKKLLLIAPLALVLVGCAKHDQPKKAEASSSSKTSIYVVKDNHKKKKTKKKSKSDKKADESKGAEKNSSNHEKTGASGNSSQLPPSDGTLTDFVNRYGMSPAAWLQKYRGLSPQQALEQTPRNMKTSGELQSENMYHGMYKNSNANTSSSSSSSEDADKYRVRPGEGPMRYQMRVYGRIVSPPTYNHNQQGESQAQSVPPQSSSQTDSVPTEVVPTE